MSSVKTCGVCGYTYVEETAKEHEKVCGERGQGLPTFVINALLYWTDQVLRKIDTDSTDPAYREIVDKAIVSTLHLWGIREKDKPDALKGHWAELIKRYPPLKGWRSKYTFPWEES